MSTRPTSERSFQTRLEIDAPPEAVWRALSDGEELRRWFAPDAQVVPGPGGTVLWRWGDDHSWPLRVEAWEPGERLLLAYDTPGPDGAPHPLLVDFRIEGRGGRTTLRLVHSGFGPEASFDTEFDGISHGWPVELQSLRLYLERHRGRPRAIAKHVAVVDVPLDEAWSRLVGPDGLDCAELAATQREGDPFALELDGERIAGTLLRRLPRELAGVAASHGDGFLRVAVERCGGPNQVWLWLATWDGRDPAPTSARFEALIGRLFTPSERAAKPAEAARA